MKGKKVLCLILAAMMGATALTACGTKPAEAPKGDASAAENQGDTPKDESAQNGESTEVTEIRFAEWDGGATLKLYEDLATRFNEKNPNIKVTVMNIPDEYDTKITTMVAGNDAPEFAMMESGTLLFPYAEEGKIRNLNDFIQADASFDSDVMMEQFKYNYTSDFLAGYTLGSENICMFYNPALFEKYGVSEPPAKYSDAWDWDTFVENAKKLTIDKNGNNALSADFDPENIDIYGVNFGRWWAIYMPMLLSAGGDFLSKDGAEIGYTSPEATDALQKLVDLIYVHHVAPTPTQGETMPGLSEAIATNKVAMSFDGQWVNESLMTDEVAYNVAAWPKVGDEARTIITYSAFSIMDTPKADAAWEFFKFMMEPGSCEPLFKSGLWLPATSGDYNENYIKSIITEQHPANYYDTIVAPMLDGTAAPPVTGYVKNFNKINDILTPALDDVWSGEKSVEEALASVKDDANAQVQGFFGK